MRLLHDLYIALLIAASAALIAQTSTWAVPLPTAIVCVGMLWISSLSVINLRRTVVVMVFPVVFVLLMKYDPGSAALVAALGSMSAQEFRIMQRTNLPALLKFIGNRAATALSASAAWGAFKLVPPCQELGDPAFLASAAGMTWVITSEPHSEPRLCFLAVLQAEAGAKHRVLAFHATVVVIN